MWRAVVAQPHDRLAKHPAIGEIDKRGGELWVESAWQLPSIAANLSAFERNRTYLSIDGTSFLDASFATGVDLDSDSRSVVAADFNRDGRTDLLIGSAGGGPLRLFLNQMETGKSLTLRLEGRESNRSGIGARIIATCGQRKVQRELFPPNGFMGQGPSETSIGLGQGAKAGKIEVRWPSGHDEYFPLLASPQRTPLILKEGSGTTTP